MAQITKRHRILIERKLERIKQKEGRRAVTHRKTVPGVGKVEFHHILEKAKLTDNMICLELCSGCETGGHYLGNQANCQIHKEIKRAIPIIEEWVKIAERNRMIRWMEGVCPHNMPSSDTFVNRGGCVRCISALKQSKEIPCPDCDGGKKSYWNIDGKHKYDCPTCKGIGNISVPSKEEGG